MEDHPIVVMVAVSSEHEAEAIAGVLLENRLAGCVQALPMTSTYRWQGQIERADEIMLLIKTRAALYGAVEAVVVAGHSYEVPEILAIPADKVFGAYRDWLIAQTSVPDG